VFPLTFRCDQAGQSYFRDQILRKLASVETVVLVARYWPEGMAWEEHLSSALLARGFTVTESASHGAVFSVKFQRNASRSADQRAGT